MSAAHANPPELSAGLDRRAVLLLDSNRARLQARGAAMRSRGAHVTCSETALRARNAWSPGSHHLVIMEFRGAGPEFKDFYQYVHGAHSEQAFAFYTSDAPYLTTVVPQMSAPVPEAPAPEPSAVSSWAGSIAEASQRIAAIRPLAHPPSERRVGSLSFSEAVKAAERIVEGA
jgi:hypothetical protein